MGKQEDLRNAVKLPLGHEVSHPESWEAKTIDTIPGLEAELVAVCIGAQGAKVCIDLLFGVDTGLVARMRIGLEDSVTLKEALVGILDNATVLALLADLAEENR